MAGSWRERLVETTSSLAKRQQKLNSHAAHAMCSRASSSAGNMDGRVTLPMNKMDGPFFFFVSVSVEEATDQPCRCGGVEGAAG